MANEAVVNELLSLITEDDSIALDGLVHDSKSKEATDINNEGSRSQLTYLLDSGYTMEQLKEELGLDG